MNSIETYSSAGLLISTAILTKHKANISTKHHCHVMKREKRQILAL